MEVDEQGMTPFDHVRWQAMNEISLLEDEINAKQQEINDLKEVQRRWNKVIKAASDEPSNGYVKPTKKRSEGIRETTRETMLTAINAIRSQKVGNDFITAELVEELESKGLSPASVHRALKVFRDEGLIRMIGKEGQAPIYRWVGD